MGIDLHARASLRKKGVLFSSKVRLKLVAAAVRRGAKGTPLEAIAEVRELKPDQEYAVTLHPASGPFYLELQDDDVVVHAKTSIAGPGYHAFVVACLDSAQRDLGLQWEWDDEGDYAEKRYFELLQLHMAFFLNHLAIHIVENCSVGPGEKIFMPADFGPEPREGEILTPSGPITMETFRHWANADIDEQKLIAADFFPWWSQGFDGAFYRGMVLHVFWSDLRWAPPLDEAERKMMKLALEWCAQAQKLGAKLPVPEAAIAELRELVASKVPRPFGEPDGIGYRRRMFTYHLTDEWTFTLPGAMERSFEGEDNETVVFSTHLLQIRVSISSGPRVDGKERIPAGAFEVDSTDFAIKDDPDFFGKRYMLAVSTSAEEDEVCRMTITGANIMCELAGKLINGLRYNGPGYGAQA